MFWSDRYIGIPYLPMGRTAEGCDCWGLIRLCFDAEFDIQLPCYSGDYLSPEEHVQIGALIRKETERDWRNVRMPEEGDCVLFDVFGEPAHIGIVIDNQRMLHIRKGAGACLESYMGPLWGPRIVGFYRHPDREM